MGRGSLRPAEVDVSGGSCLCWVVSGIRSASHDLCVILKVRMLLSSLVFSFFGKFTVCREKLHEDEHLRFHTEFYLEKHFILVGVFGSACGKGGGMGKGKYVYYAENLRD